MLRRDEMDAGGVLFLFCYGLDDSCNAAGGTSCMRERYWFCFAAGWTSGDVRAVLQQEMFCAGMGEIFCFGRARDGLLQECGICFATMHRFFAFTTLRSTK